MWTKLNTAGQTGSEGGRILCDEEYGSACRITLEDCGDRFAVTCGVYGAFVHTAFCSDPAVYTAMKAELEQFLQTDTTADDEIAFYESLAARY